jgi:hypothetical protein
MTTKDKDAVREMMQTEGWRIFVAHLKGRESVLMENLIYCKPEEVVQGQMQIKAIREIVMKPKMLLEGGPDDEAR